MKGQTISFKVTPKARQSGNFLSLVHPQITIVAATGFAMVWALVALGLGTTSHSATGVVSNILWGGNNCLAMAGIIGAALWVPRATTESAVS